MTPQMHRSSRQLVCAGRCACANQKTKGSLPEEMKGTTFDGCYGCRNDEQKPRRIAALRGIEVTQVSTGGWHCLALDAAGMVYAWGGNEYGQCHVEWAVR